MGDKAYRIHIRQGEFELDVEGDRAFVESYVDAFLAEEGEFEPPQEKVTRGKGAPGKVKGRRSRPRKGPVDVDRAALKAFVKGKKASSNKDRYLLYMRFWRSQGLNQVDDSHVQACFSAEGLPIPPTGRQNFGSLRKEGLVKEGTSRGMWALTDQGVGEEPKAAAAKPARKAAQGARTRKARATRSGKATPAKKSANRKAPKRKARRARKPAKPPIKSSEVPPSAPE